MKRVDILQSSMEIGYSPKIKAINHSQLQCLDSKSLNKSSEGLELHTTCNSKKWQGKAAAHALPCHYNLCISASHHTRGVCTLLIMQLKSLPPKGPESLSWDLMKNPDRFLCTTLQQIGGGGHSHISATHSSYTNEFPQCSSGKTL